MTPHQLGEELARSLSALVEEGRLPRLRVDEPLRSGVRRPRDPARGDYACTTALEVAAVTGLPPRQVAGLLGELLVRAPGVESVEVAGPGFLNVRVSAGERLADLVRLLDEAPAPPAPPVGARVTASIGSGWDPGGRADVGNPRYLVLLAHARAAALLRNATLLGLAPGREGLRELLTHPRELELTGLLVDLLAQPPDPTPADTPRLQRLARDLEAVATAFLGCQEARPALPVGDEEPGTAHRARLLLVHATRVALARGLGSLRLDAPERM